MPHQPPGPRASAFVPVNGPAIREARLAAGLSVAQLADRVGVGKAYISKLELGHSPRCSANVHAALVVALRPRNRSAFRKVAA